MVNRSRSRNMRRSQGRSRGRRMRGGVDGVGPVVEVVEVVEGEGSGVDESKPVVAPPESNSWVASIPGLDSATEGASSFLSGATKEVTGIASTGTNLVKGFLPGSAPVAAGTESPEKASGAAASWWGGKRRSKQMRMKGGRGLGLDYYATSVNGIKVAHPTYMEYYKGGKRRSCKKRRSSKRRRRTCKKRRSKRRSCKR